MTNKGYRVAIVAWKKKTSVSIKKQLDSLFEQCIEFSCFSLDEWMGLAVDTDLVLVSTGVFANKVASKVKPGIDIIIIRRTLLKDGWKKLESLPPGKTYMLVNDGRDFAIETISLIYELGARYIELIPVFPGMKDVPNIEGAITPGESQLVPDFVEEVIDIGERVVDVSTIVDILSHFNLLSITEISSILASYTSRIVPRNQGTQTTINTLIKIKKLMQQTLDMVQEGVIICDEKGIITSISREAETIIGSSAWDVIGQELDTLGLELVVENDYLKDEVIKIGQQNVICNKLSIKTDGKITGTVLTLQVANKVEELELKLRTQRRASGHVAKYSFHHMVSKSKKMNEIIRHAQVIAGSDLNVLILGESGTGKELFAQAIHNYSPRKKYPFVAVNCSSLPDNLLESELFGYEEGAFTGAKKGGKPGFFEQAHNGTIFLDEIGDISPNLQSRLLRVIQQKEVLKIGGTKIIPINVRIIAATNKNLSKLVEEAKFRDDLYYRLKVAQIEIPPLIERKEDIPYLVTHFLEKSNFKGEVPGKIMVLLLQHNWPGNIRELENTINYLAIITEGFSKIDESFINDYFRNLGLLNQEDGRDTIHINEEIGHSEKRMPQECLEIDLKKYVLQAIYKARVEGLNIGRRSLVNSAKENGLIVSESQVRRILGELEHEGLIEVFKGRGGCQLTKEGYFRINKE